MIDRKTLWILGLLCLAMTAAAFWRLSLLPDWTQLPMTTPHGVRIRNGLVLFVPLLSLLLPLAVTFAFRWLVTASDEAIQAYQRRNRLMLLGLGVILAVAQIVLLSRSLGHDLGLDRDVFSRVTIVASAVLMMMQGNNMPKLPWVSSRFAMFQLDPWQSARSKRFTGRISIGFGLIMIAAAALLPVRAIALIVFALCPVYLGVVFWHTMRLKREPSPQP